MKKFFSKILAYIMIVIDLVFFGILPMTSLSEKGVSPAEDPIYLTAHRGVRAQAPENTLPAFRLAIEKGYYSAETDVHLTQDGVWVLSHNTNLKKWYNADVEIKDRTYAELLQYKVKNGRGRLKYGTLRIPTLDEYLSMFVGKACRPQIEIKTIDEGNRGLDSLVKSVQDKGLSKQAIVIGYDLDQLRYVRSLDRELELWLLCDGEITQKEIDDAKSIGGSVWLSCNWQANTVESMQKAIDAGVPVSMFTVDEVEDAKMLYDAGFRYMETDSLAP